MAESHHVHFHDLLCLVMTTLDPVERISIGVNPENVYSR
jgi:hypothetical protein